MFATHCLHLQQHTQFFKGLFAVTLLYILFYLSTLLFVIAFQKMPKQAASGKTKVNAFIREFHNEFISTPTDELFCKLCEKVVKHDKRFHVDQHRNGSVHQAKLTIPTTSRQSFISTPNIPNFTTIYFTLLVSRIFFPIAQKKSETSIKIRISWYHLLRPPLWKTQAGETFFTKLVHHHSPLSRDWERGLMLQWNISLKNCHK